MPHRFRAATFLCLTAFAGLELATKPAFAQEAPAPTVTTPAAPTVTPPTAPALNAPPPKQSLVPPAPVTSLSRLIDLYYQYQFSNLKNSSDLKGRISAYRHNTPTLGLAWLDVAHTPAPTGMITATTPERLALSKATRNLS